MLPFTASLPCMDYLSKLLSTVSPHSIGAVRRVDKSSCFRLLLIFNGIFLKWTLAPVFDLMIPHLLWSWVCFYSLGSFSYHLLGWLKMPFFHIPPRQYHAEQEQVFSYTIKECFTIPLSQNSVWHAGSYLRRKYLFFISYLPLCTVF